MDNFELTEHYEKKNLKRAFRNDALNHSARYFDENRTHPKATTDAPRFIEFDWEVLRRNLGEAREELGEEGFGLLADALDAVLCWIVKGGIVGLENRPKRSKSKRLELFGRRAVALLWSLDPSIFDGKSLRNLEKDFGLPSSQLREFSRHARRKFNLKNRGQCHGSNFGTEKSIPKINE